MRKMRSYSFLPKKKKKKKPHPPLQCSFNSINLVTHNDSAAFELGRVFMLFGSASNGGFFFSRFSAKYNKMISCVKSTLKICMGDRLSESSIDRIVRQSYKENTLCYEGALETPTMPAVGSPCSSSFSADARNCVKTFHQKFVADKSDPSLCA